MKIKTKSRQGLLTPKGHKIKRQQFITVCPAERITRHAGITVCHRSPLKFHGMTMGAMQKIKREKEGKKR
jgi:hypothetical protein